MVVRIAGNTDDCSVGAFAVKPAPSARRTAPLELLGAAEQVQWSYRLCLTTMRR